VACNHNPYRNLAAIILNELYSSSWTAYTIMGSCHFLNCINYLLHTALLYSSVGWKKLIIAIRFKSVLHPGLTTSSHVLTEMKELEQCLGLVSRCRWGFQRPPPYLHCDPVYASNLYFLQLSAQKSSTLVYFRTEDWFNSGVLFPPILQTVTLNSQHEEFLL
jgi:hypothetical protein